MHNVVKIYLPKDGDQKQLFGQNKAYKVENSTSLHQYISRFNANLAFPLFIYFEFVCSFCVSFFCDYMYIGLHSSLFSHCAQSKEGQVTLSFEWKNFLGFKPHATLAYFTIIMHIKVCLKKRCFPILSAVHEKYHQTKNDYGITDVA